MKLVEKKSTAVVLQVMFRHLYSKCRLANWNRNAKVRPHFGGIVTAALRLLVFQPTHV